jgi:hypothetical protein
MYCDTIKPLLRRLRLGEGMEAVERLLAAHLEPGGQRPHSIINAIAAVREFHVLRDTGALSDEHTAETHSVVARALFRYYCAKPGGLIDITSSGLLDYLSLKSETWRVFAEDLISDKLPRDSELVACLGPGTVSVGASLSELTDLTIGLEIPSPSLGQKEFLALRQWLLALKSDRQLGLALVEEW